MKINSADIANQSGDSPSFEDFGFQSIAQSKTTFIVLLAFNILAASFTAGQILFDSWKIFRKDLLTTSTTRAAGLAFIRSIPSFEIFPLILSIAIVIQSLVFIGVQSGTRPGQNCTNPSQLVWAAFWIVPSANLIFAIELALRSLQTPRFSPRKAWTIPICLAALIVLLIVCWASSKASPERNFCFTNLLWFVQRDNVAGIFIAVFFAALLIVSGGLIYLALRKAFRIESSEQISASWMIHYIILAVISLILILPSLIQAHIHSIASTNTATMTTIVQCISGMTSGLLHLFLRGIGPLVTHRADPASAPYQYMDGPKDQSCLNIIDHLQNPIRVISVKRNKSIRSPPAGFLKALEEGHPQENREEKPQPQIVSPPPQAVLSPYHHKRNQSSAYSIFPASPPMPVIISSSNPKPSSPLVRSPSKSPINLTRTTPQNSSPTPSLFPLPPSIETILGLPSPQPSLSSGISATSLLLPPPPCRRSRPFSFTSVTSMGHKRKSSIGSTTTVQIGLRLSHALPLSYTLHHSHVQEKAQSPPSIQKDEQGVAAEVLPLLHGQNLAREPHQAESSPQAAAQSWEKSLKEAQLPHDHHFRPPPRLRIHPLRQIHIISSPPQSPRSLAPPALRIVHINGRSKSNAAATSFSAHRAEVALRSPSLPHLNIPSNPSRKLNSHGEDICMKTLPPTPHTPSPAPTTATTTPAALPLRSLSLRDFGASNNSNVSAITRSSQLVRLGLDLDLALGLAPGGASGLMSPDLLSSGFLSSGILSPVSSMGSPKASSLMRARTGVVRFVMHKSQSRDDGEWF